MLETQALNQLDRGAVVLRQSCCHPPQPSPPHEVRHSVPYDLLAATQAPVKHDQVHIGIEADPHLCGRCEPNDFLPPHKLVELVRGGHHAFFEGLKRAGNNIVKHLWVPPHVLPQHLELAPHQHQRAETKWIQRDVRQGRTLQRGDWSLCMIASLGVLLHP